MTITFLFSSLFIYLDMFAKLIILLQENVENVTVSREWTAFVNRCYISASTFESEDREMTIQSTIHSLGVHLHLGHGFDACKCLPRGSPASRRFLPASCFDSFRYTDNRFFHNPSTSFEHHCDHGLPLMHMSRIRSSLNRTARLGMAAAAASRVTVTLPEPTSTASEGKPSHWANDEGTLFRNPWESFKQRVVSPSSLHYLLVPN